nr:hypothetical protein [Armatimonas sp.]
MALRRENANFLLRKVDPSVHREPPHGWLLPYLLEGDDLTWRRWEWWGQQMALGTIGEDDPIPEIDFEQSAHPQTRRMLEQCLDAIPSHGAWNTWGGSQYFDYFLDWLLYGLGHKGQTEPPREPEKGASDRLYQLFQLTAMQLWPYDYFGDLLADVGFGKAAGFYPTPMGLCDIMARMNFASVGDARLQTFLDPCIGTGRMALLASNHVLRLYGQDINGTMVKATLVNAAIFAPWMFRPLPFLDEKLKAYTLPEPLIQHMLSLSELGEWQRICVPFSMEGELTRAVMTMMDESCGLTLLGEGQSLDDVPGTWDRILLAPPLFNAEETDHVRAAYERLAPGGVMVALVTGTWIRSEDVRLTSFRKWWLSLPEALRRFEPLCPEAMPDVSSHFSLGIVQLRKT